MATSNTTTATGNAASRRGKRDAGQTITELSAALGVSVRTLYNWRSDPNFPVRLDDQTPNAVARYSAKAVAAYAKNRRSRRSN